MTIVEAIQKVLKFNPNGMTKHEIYDKIIEEKLYVFKAKDPKNVLNWTIRTRCEGLDFPTAKPVKYFKIVGSKENEVRYALLEIEPVKSVMEINDDIERIPEEVINSAFEQHISQIHQDLLDRLLVMNPKMFEHLVLEVLMAMGYGYDEKAGKVTRYTKDSGIDGIISEDKLGLDLIYLQAKRNNKNKKVGREIVQSFIGAMSSVNKGVFITTSDFTKDAKEFAENKTNKNIKLINGNQLVEYMIKYRIGIESMHTFTLYKIKDMYFDY